MASAPLSWAPSSEPTQATISETLPSEVITCLSNARFLHLATCSNTIPHVSLMNYTYLPHTPDTPLPTIIMTTNSASRKTVNLASNPHVSLLVHDWVSQRTAAPSELGASPPRSAAGDTNPSTISSSSAAPQPSSLAALLSGLNTAALARISVTISGTARLLDCGSEAEKHALKQHIANHSETGAASSSEDAVQALSTATSASADNADAPESDLRVVSVQITGGRIADWKGGVKDFIVSSDSDATNRSPQPLANGVT